MQVILQELGILKQSFTRYIVVLIGVLFVLLGCTLKPLPWFDGVWRFPLPGSPSLATQLFLSAQHTLVPPQVPIIALGPVAVFFAPFLMALLIALLITFPYAFYLGVRFLLPALHRRERQLLIVTSIPALILFYAGCALAYFLIIPKTYEVLYGFAEPMGITSYFALDQFISSVFLITIGVGISFLFPVVMVLASWLGLIQPAFWVVHWRGAFLGILLFAAVVTPDGSGVTMLLLSCPLILLYGLGCFLAQYRLAHT